jgi:hypothetical protein
MHLAHALVINPASQHHSYRFMISIPTGGQGLPIKNCKITFNKKAPFGVNNG